MARLTIFQQTKPGSLHRALGVKPGVKIPLSKLRIAMTWTRQCKCSEHDRLLAGKAALVYRLAQKRTVLKAAKHDELVALKK